MHGYHWYLSITDIKLSNLLGINQSGGTCFLSKRKWACCVCVWGGFVKCQTRHWTLMLLANIQITFSINTCPFISSKWWGKILSRRLLLPLRDGGPITLNIQPHKEKLKKKKKFFYTCWYITLHPCSVYSNPEDGVSPMCWSVDDFGERSAGGTWALLVVGQPLMVKACTVDVYFTSAPRSLYSLFTRASVRAQPCSLYHVELMRFKFLHIKMNWLPWGKK